MFNKLRILQYNAHKLKKKILIGLLQDLRVAIYDIITI
jgi:hypothetical protein